MLSFLNSNWYRQYPFKGDTSLIATSGELLPNDILSGCRLMLDQSHMGTGVQVKRLYHHAGTINVEFVAMNSSLNSGILGYAHGIITTANQSVMVTSDVPTFSGFITIGNQDTLQTTKCYNFADGDAILEPSTITIYTPPPITGLTHQDQKLTGQVTFVPTNLIMTVANNNIHFDVLKPDEVESRSDADHSVILLTCLNPVIGGINTVQPIKTTDYYNIDIYGIAPVEILHNHTTEDITVTSSLELVDICNPVNIPPTANVNGIIWNSNTSTYDITTTTQPEWQQWGTL